VPIAIERNRVQSYLDKVQTEQTGEYRHGDAAFADYLLNLGITYRFHQAQPASDNIMIENWDGKK
jgi:hypothetical protein